MNDKNKEELVPEKVYDSLYIKKQNAKEKYRESWLNGNSSSQKNSVKNKANHSMKSIEDTDEKNDLVEKIKNITTIPIIPTNLSILSPYNYDFTI